MPPTADSVVRAAADGDPGSSTKGVAWHAPDCRRGSWSCGGQRIDVVHGGRRHLSLFQDFLDKNGLFVSLLINGLFLVRAERQVELDRPRSWHWLTVTSIISIALWFLTTLAGAALPNIG